METQKLLNTLAKGAGISAAGTVISKILTYFYRILVARGIGPEAYGQLSLGLAVLGILGSLSLLSVDQALNRYVAEFRSENDYGSIKGMMISAAEITLIPSLAVVVIMYLSAGFIATNIFNSPGLTPVLKVFAFVAPFSNFSSIFIATINAFKKLKYVVITNHIFQNAVQLLVTAVFIYAGYGVLGAAIGWLVGVVLSAILAFYFLETRIGPIMTRDVSYTRYRRKILRFSSPLVMSAIIGSVLGWTDTLLLGYLMEDTANVGFYNAAFPTAALIVVPYGALNSLALPSLSEVGDDRGKARDLLENLLRWTMIVSFPAFILMALFSRQILHLLFGAEYTVAATALTILAFGQLYTTATGHLGDFIKSVSRTDIIMKNTFVNFLLNIGLNLLLIPHFGIAGAAAATAGSMVFVNSLLVVESYYYEKVVPLSSRMWKSIAASILPLVPVYAGINIAFETVPLWALFPGALLYGILYLPSLAFLGGVEEEDRDIIVGVGRRISMEEESERLADYLIQSR